MCIHIVFPPSTQQVAEAQWALVDELDRALRQIGPQADARRLICDALLLARHQAPSPFHWAEEFARALTKSLVTRQASADAARLRQQADALRRERDSLQRILAEYRADPLHDQVQRLSQERDEYRRWAATTLARAERAESDLAQAQERHDQERSRLQQTIADLNRILAESQSQLIGDDP